MKHYKLWLFNDDLDPFSWGWARQEVPCYSMSEALRFARLYRKPATRRIVIVEPVGGQYGPLSYVVVP